MIDKAYAVTMARYNAWQNRQMQDAMESLPLEALTEDRGAFFGSLLATANHILWGDRLWMALFDGGAGPDVGSAESTALCPTLAVWSAERFRTDGRIQLWAEKLRSVDLHGDMEWFSASQGRQMRLPVGVCITHMFNHQTHHRGQIHAMLTAVGAKGPVTDLIFMPEG